MAENADIHEFKERIADLDRRFADTAMVIYRPDGEDLLFLHRLLEYYLMSGRRERNEVLDAMRGRYGVLNLLVGCVYDAAENIRGTDDTAVLRIGLAAASIEDFLGRTDYRDRLMALAELYVAAEEAGLDPDPAFREICGITGFSDTAVVKSRRMSGRPWV